MLPDDLQLIAAFQAGEYRAFDLLYQRYARRVLGFAYQLTGDSAEAEDLTQETFVGAFKGMQAFRCQSQVLTWLLSITMRRWRDMQRCTRPQTVPYPGTTCSPALADTMPAMQGPDSCIDSIAMRSAIDRLDAPLREAFLLIVVQELTYREAAQILECPLGTLKGRVARALAEVRTRLQTKEEDHVSCLLP